MKNKGPLIRINDNYLFRRGLDCWELHRACEQKKETKETSYIKTYHATLEQLSKKVLSDTALSKTSIQDVLKGFEQAKSEIVKAIGDI